MRTKIILAHRAAECRDYCRKNNIPRSRAIFLNVAHKDSHLRISGTLLHFTDVVVLARPSRLLEDWLFHRILRGMGNKTGEYNSYAELVGTILLHLRTEIEP